MINKSFFQNSMNYQHSFMLYAFEPFIRCNMLNMMQFILWAIMKRLTESESILLKRGIEAHFRARLQPYFQPVKDKIMLHCLSRLVYSFIK